MKKYHISSIQKALVYLLCFIIYGCMPISVMVVHAMDLTKQSQEIKEISYSNDPRTHALKMLLSEYNSPLIDSAEIFVQESDRYGIDWRLLVSIAGVESKFGQQIPKNSYNAWGWAVYTGKQSGAVFTSWEEAICLISKELRKKYYTHGAKTTEQIGKKYAADPRWAQKVNFFIAKINTIQTNRVIAYQVNK
jgi:hypothetical protein